MAKIGLLNPTYAPITTETENAPITYGDGVTFASAIEAGVAFKRNGDNPLYGDDVIIENDNSIYGGEVSIGVDDVAEDDQVAMLGVREIGEVGSEEYHDAAVSAPYVGFGYIQVRRKNGVTSYIGNWFHKVQFAESDESATTKKGAIEWKTPTLKGTIFGVNIDTTGEPKFRVRKPCATYAAALTWLQGKANISSGT